MNQPPSFGARFLEEWKRLDGPLSAWSYAELQELRGCDRGDLIRALRGHQPHLSYAALQHLRKVESPEALARNTLDQARRAANANVWVLFAALT